MQQAGWTALALGLALCASSASAQEQTQTHSVAAQPAVPAAAKPAGATPGFEPAPVPSHPTAPPDIATPNPTDPGGAPLSPGNVQLRLGGRVTDYVGAFSGSGR